MIQFSLARRPCSDTRADFFPDMLVINGMHVVHVNSAMLPPQPPPISYQSIPTLLYPPSHALPSFFSPLLRPKAPHPTTTALSSHIPLHLLPHLQIDLEEFTHAPIYAHPFAFVEVGFVVGGGDAFFCA